MIALGVVLGVLALAGVLTFGSAPPIATPTPPATPEPVRATPAPAVVEEEEAGPPPGEPPPTERPRVGVVLVGEPEDHSWGGMALNGAHRAAEELGVEVIPVVTPGGD